jgi:GAF domain
MVLTGMAAGVRDLVADSWLRSMAAGINVDASEPPITLDQGLLNDYRAEHPLSRIFPLLYDVLGKAAEDCDSVMAVADELGQLLWVCGRPAVLRRAEAISFVEGAQWDEEHAGTNAPGTALRLDAPVTIKAAEHFVRPVQRWSCAAAPIHDPVTHRILGVVDVTGGDDIGSPQTIAMIRAAARMAESELAYLDNVRQASVRSPAPGWRPGGADGLPPGYLHLRGLGRPDVVVSAGRRSLRLSPRHSEIVVVLAGRPDGVSGDELATLLYPGDVTSSTLRAEMVRLRALLGDQALASRPYRLTGDVSSDWAAVSSHLATGNVTAALRGYHGPLLPNSEAPGVVRQRDDLHDWLRAMILADGRHELLVSWTQARWGAEDLPMWQRQCAVLPASSPLRPRAEAAAARLDAELRR